MKYKVIVQPTPQPFFLSEKAAFILIRYAVGFHLTKDQALQIDGACTAANAFGEYQVRAELVKILDELRHGNIIELLHE